MTLDDALKPVVAWAEVAFPNSTPRSKALHIAKEAAELLEDPTDGEEMADVVMIVAHLAASQGVDLAAEIAKKHGKNLKRWWGPPDENGVVEHVRSGPS